MRLALAKTVSVALCLLLLGLLDAEALEADTSLAIETGKLVTSVMNPPADSGAPAISGMSVAIGRAGTLLYADGFGIAAPGRPATARTIYMVGSITKQFTAAALLRLIDKGASIRGRSETIKLDTPVADILDAAHDWQLEGGPPITISNLLSMTSNLPNYTRRPPRDLDPWGAVPARQLLTAIKGYRPSGYPGSFEYSNTSYFLLSEIMEQLAVAGSTRSYHQILEDEIFVRLGLSDTGFRADPHIAARLATPHYKRRPRFFQPDWLKGSGDVASTVIDIFKWNSELMAGTALSAGMRAVMFSDSGRVDAWTYYGAGWFVSHKDEVDRYFHSGTVSGYTSFNLIVQPKNHDWVSVVLLADSDGVQDIDVLAEHIAQLVRAH